MDLLSLIPDNISEVLLKIIQFTELRRSVLYRNIHGVNTPGYSPRDLPVVEFAEVLNAAINEHVQHHRLLFRDTANIAFGGGGAMRIHPIADEGARTLLETNRDEYLELQIDRLLENSLNQKVAEQLMQQNTGPICGSVRVDRDEVMASDMFPEDLPSPPNSTH